MGISDLGTWHYCLTYVWPLIQKQTTAICGQVRLFILVSVSRWFSGLLMSAIIVTVTLSSTGKLRFPAVLSPEIFISSSTQTRLTEITWLIGHNPQGSSSTELWIIALYNFLFPCVHTGWDSSVGIATRYGMDAPGIESRWGRDFPHPSRPVLGPT